MVSNLPLKIIYGFLILTYSTGFAQENENSHEGEPDSHDFKHNRVAVILGHGHVFGAVKTDGANLITIPTWGIDYQYWINQKFGVGLKGDIEIMEYVVETEEEIQLTRTNPFIISTVFLYNPFTRGYFLMGPGIEFEENHNFFIIRFGAGYEFEIPGHWDFSPEILFDLKEGHIGSFTWGIGVGKRF